MTDRPTDHLRIALAQLNPVMGDIAGNLAKARAARATAAEGKADLILFPELFICGYPPEDLVMKPALQADCRAAVEAFAPDTADGGPARPDRHALARGRTGPTTRWPISTAARSRASRARSICRITACSTKSASSPSDPCRARSTSAACASACRSARTSGRPTSSNACRETGAGILARAERLALRCRASATCACITPLAAWSRADCRWSI